jgi:UDP-N-acetylmuramoyl-L-alanyl-D-glutamate--2,6-diaminopimelate ligase
MLHSMNRAGCQACVMEVSSHALEQSRVYGIDFDIAIFTNLTQDHLDFHGTMDSYYEAKKKLFLSLEQGAKAGAAIINIDDPYGVRLSEDSNLEVQLTYGLGESAKLRATRIQMESQGTTLLVQTPDHQFNCRLPLIGRHNIYNALAAVGAGLALPVGVPVIKTALNTMEPVPGRLEMVSRSQPFGVYVDYAHTDDALRNVLQTLREITQGRLLLTFGCGGNRDRGKRAKMGRVAADLADFSIITSDNPRREDPGTIAHEIEAGFLAAGKRYYEVELDRRRAINQVIRMAERGDSVLIAGKGHETYQEFQDTIVPFDDHHYAEETLECLLAAPQPHEHEHACD